MMESLVGLDKLETEAFAYVVFAAKIITWTALLTLAAIVEFALVRKIYRAEFGERKRHLARGQEWDTSADTRDRYIRSSELRSFAYCERAWRFEYDGASSTLDPERAVGRREDAEHSRHAVLARTISYVGAVMLGFSIVGLLIGLGIWVLQS